MTYRFPPGLQCLRVLNELADLDMGSCLNDGPFLGTLNIRCRIIIRTPKRDHNCDNHPHALHPKVWKSRPTAPQRHSWKLRSLHSKPETCPVQSLNHLRVYLQWTRPGPTNPELYNALNIKPPLQLHIHPRCTLAAQVPLS